MILSRKLLTLILLLPLLVSQKAIGQNELDEQIRTISDTFASRLIKTGKKRVTVSNFLDLRGNVTEFGRYLAESFSTQLSNTDLEIVERNRSMLDDLIAELILTDSKITRPENALKRGEMAGVEYIITGTITILDNTMEITIKALDIEKGTSIAGQKASIKRTDGINNLMRSIVAQGGTSAANANLAKKIDTEQRSATDDIYETRISDLRKGECTRKGFDRINTFGQVCFENQTGEDLYFTCDAEGTNGNLLAYEKVGLTQQARNCSSLIYINRWDVNNVSVEVKFTFQTLDDFGKKALMTVAVEACKVKSIVLTKKNLVFTK